MSPSRLARGNEGCEGGPFPWEAGDHTDREEEHVVGAQRRLELDFKL